MSPDQMTLSYVIQYLIFILYVCVCVCERERESVCLWDSVYVCIHVCICVCQCLLHDLQKYKLQDKILLLHCFCIHL